MLNDTRIRNAKPAERDYKLTDFDGLYLLIRKNGSRLWRFAYRFDRKQKQIALGAYPEVTLAEARDRREASRKLLANGKDPSLERRLEKIAKAAGGNCFREVAEEFLDKQRREGRAEATLGKNRWLLEPAYATFGDRPIGEVTAPELLHALRKFELRERYESARRLRAVAGMVFRYAIATGRATRDISVDLRGALTTPKENHRAAITEPSEVGALLRAIEGYSGQPTTRLALQLSALLFVRPGEMRLARWKEIDFEKAVWTVPAETMKMKRPHRVPLSRQAIVIFRELHAMTGQGEYVFPAVNSFRRPMSDNTLNAGLRRLGYAKDEISVSGFRATASTLLNEMGRWNPDAIERQLAHMEENDVRRAYMHAAEFWSERVEMMQVWADHLDQLRHCSRERAYKAVRGLSSSRLKKGALRSMSGAGKRRTSRTSRSIRRLVDAGLEATSKERETQVTKIFKTISLARRPITGPIQFGDDFPGVFIRGDDALSYAATLRRALESPPTIDDARLAKLAELTKLLGSCRITRS